MPSLTRIGPQPLFCPETPACEGTETPLATSQPKAKTGHVTFAAWHAEACGEGGCQKIVM